MQSITHDLHPDARARRRMLSASARRWSERAAESATKPRCQAGGDALEDEPRAAAGLEATAES